MDNAFASFQSAYHEKEKVLIIYIFNRIGFCQVVGCFKCLSKVGCYGYCHGILEKGYPELWKHKTNCDNIIEQNNQLAENVLNTIRDKIITKTNGMNFSLINGTLNKNQ